MGHFCWGGMGWDGMGKKGGLKLENRTLVASELFILSMFQWSRPKLGVGESDFRRFGSAAKRRVLVLFEGQNCPETLQQMSWLSLFSVLKNFGCSKIKVFGFSRGKNRRKLLGEVIEIWRVLNLIEGRCRSLSAAEE